ncbi:MAG: alpha/beta hydrolase [Actinomycetia bacterium]|nr:alpha/beta hydrolase [Actinomycetes bacterium]
MSTRGFIDTGEEQIYFESWGDERETVILNHGLGGSHATWFQQVAFLTPRYRVITWDQRGFGRSTRASGEIGPVPAMHDMGHILDHLEIDSAHVIGQSMGGWSALGFAIEHPQRVLSLVLADTTAGIFSPETRQTLIDYGMTIASGPPVDQLPLGHHPAIGSALVDGDLSHAFLYGQLGSLTDPPAPWEIMPLLMATDHTNGASHIDVRTLFIVGEHDPIFPPSLIRSAANIIARSEVAVIESSGHSPYFERPGAWNDIVATFLRQSSH